MSLARQGATVFVADIQACACWHIGQAGPARVVIGEYQGVRSPVKAPSGVDYLLVTLRPGEKWTYQPPAGHTTGWLALASGELDAGQVLRAGEMMVFAADGEASGP